MDTEEIGASQGRADTRRLILAFALAPAAAPVVLAILTFAGGMLFSDPKDPGTPVGIVIVPLLLLTLGMVGAYVTAGVCWWPVVWWLQRRGALNFLSLHAAGFLLAVGLSVCLTLGMHALTAPPRPPLQDLLLPCLVTSAVLIPATMASVLVFWWLMRALTPSGD